MRTRNNGELRINNVGEVVTLVGWCAKKRDLGGLVFIDLRDRWGITQVIVEPNNEYYNVAVDVKNEYVLKATLLYILPMLEVNPICSLQTACTGSEHTSMMQMTNKYMCVQLAKNL